MAQADVTMGAWSGVVSREPVLLVLLCDAVAQGMIQPWSGAGASQETQDGGGRGAPPGDKAKKAAGKGAERSSSVHGVFLDPAALQDVRKALEVCVGVGVLVFVDLTVAWGHDCLFI